MKADWEKKTLLPLLQKMYGPKLKLLTPKLAKKFVGHTVHCVFGQRWMDHNKGGVADRKSAISLITIVDVDREHVVFAAVEGGAPSVVPGYLYDGYFTTGSGADPIAIFV